jgi:hypothetical protein
MDRNKILRVSIELQNKIEERIKRKREKGWKGNRRIRDNYDEKNAIGNKKGYS